MKEITHLGKLKRRTYKLESLHADIAGTLQYALKGYDGTTCVAVIRCDHTNVTWKLLLKSKGEFLRAFKTFLGHYEIPERRCHLLTLDKAGKNTSKQLECICNSRRVAMYFTATGQHQ
ncbi:hypothetical protein F4782DRAFT_528186 [Xylaria castorea]|nr:hypothetical protein F4782DRAFT_528186 [Xylaria castorea]